MSSTTSFLDIVFSGGWIGVVIVTLLAALSLGALALAIEHLMTIRRSVLMPPGLAERVANLLANRDLAGAAKACDAEPSFLSFVVRAALTEADGGWPAAVRRSPANR